MNKNIEEYKKKFNKIIRTIKLLAIFIFILGILISIVQYTINKSKSIREKQNSVNGDSDYIINLEDNMVVYQNNLDINLKIKDFQIENNYKIIIKINEHILIEQDILEDNCTYNINLTDEGKKIICILIYKANEENYNKSFNVYYIEPYQKQILDELSNRGVVVHFRNGDMEDYEKSIPLLNKFGTKYIRDDLYFYAIYNNKSGKYNFSNYDKWIEEATKNNLKIVGILTTSMSTLTGNDKIINTDEEINKFAEISCKIAIRYPQIEYYEILNEPNYATDARYSYMSKEDIEWYSKLVEKVSKELKNINPKIKILAGATATAMEDGDTYISSKKFMYEMTNLAYLNSFGYSFHPYDIYNSKIQNDWMYYKLNTHNEVFQELGGFIKKNLTEYGVSSYKGKNINEEQQAEKLVQQTTITDFYQSHLAIIYNFRSKGNDENDIEYNYGILHNDYTPKPAYYAMKNYYQNTNGAEYIGPINLENGLEAHVYDKDGKPLIIAWSSNTDNTYDFKINSMTAKDLYGKDIAPDENGNIKITTSPVYLYNADTSYFYNAIATTTLTKYNEFTEKFAEQISKVPGFQASIQKLMNEIDKIKGNSSFSETTAVNLMKEHYNLGDIIIQSYKSKTLQIEYVKLSSMLDMLDDIGDSFEDLVTVSGKTRNSNLNDTKNLITEVENLINNNEDLSIIYPTKILEFSKDFYDTSSYINGLTEENDIKTGLIISKNLHSILLANWAKNFANLYIDEYIEKNPVEIEYSNTQLTNKDVTATLKTNAEVTVTNNQSSKTYTFKENGDFTFEYTIKGRKFNKKATVTNIDKTPPVISGVVNDGFYTLKVTPKVTDTNLQDVKLYKDSKQVTNYKANSEISEDGAYRLEAIDKAGNKAEVSFDICHVPASISYSETNPTNKEVIATISSKYDFEVTNNFNKKQYTFTKNGTYTFNYKIKTKEFNITAKVDWIDN